MRLGQRLAVRYIRTKFKLLSSISKRKAAAKAFLLFCTPQTRHRKKLPPVFEKAEKLQFSLGNNIVRGYRWNHPSSKKALILHGFESSITNFDRYIKPLTKKGYEVLAFDAPAHGRSAGKTITVLTYKEMVLQIVNAFGPVDAFLAHSFGGLALGLALEEMPNSAPKKVVFIAPAAETRRAIDNFFIFLRLDDEVRREFDAQLERTGGKRAEWFSLKRAAYNIKAQVLYLQDKDDELTPLEDVRPIMEDGHANFRFVITEGLGHRRIYRDNRIFKEIMDFL